MDRIKIKVDQVASGCGYQSIAGDVNGKRCSFVIADFVDISGLEGKTVVVVQNDKGEFIIEHKSVASGN